MNQYIWTCSNCYRDYVTQQTVCEECAEVCNKFSWSPHEGYVCVLSELDIINMYEDRRILNGL